LRDESSCEPIRAAKISQALSAAVYFLTLKPTIMQISTELKQQLEARFGSLPSLPGQFTTPVNSNTQLWPYLQACEQDLINLMNGNPPPENSSASIEYSWVLYFLNNDLYAFLTKLGLGAFYEPLIEALKITYGPMPASKITPATWTTYETTWKGAGVLYGDGSLVSTSYYAVMDVEWATALIYYYLSIFGLYNGVLTPFPTTPASVQFSEAEYPSLRVALFGDWGTGAYADGNLSASPSQLIGQQITKANPDVTIHLGDVYYAGTSSGFVFNGEEVNNLVNCWPTPASDYNFTLNSNHEMYSGANGYFTNALGNSIFNAQTNTSYFQLRYGSWLILGLDSAYYDTSSLYMNGALTDTNQLAFLNTAGKYALANNLQVVVLTHHTALNTTGDAQTSLYAQVVNALQMPGQGPNGTNAGVMPSYWYYGHIHNGVVYSANSASGGINCRCLGNAAIPIGNSSWLQDAMNGASPTVTFYTNTPLPNPTVQQSLRVLNGYAILTFTPTTVVETWYNQDGSQAWTSAAS
jgi:Calcineurin-like phosphoesterase